MKLRGVLFFILILLQNYSIGQSNNKIDSLTKVLSVVGSDTGKVNVLNSLAIAHFQVNMDTALYYANSAFKLSKEIRYVNGLANVYSTYGRALISTGSYDDAIEISKEGLEFFDSLLNKSKDKDEIKKRTKNKTTLLKNLGISFDLLGIYPEALKYYTECLKVEESMGERKSSAGTYHNIGGIYLDLENYDEALTYFRKAYEINKELKNIEWMTNNLGNIAIAYSYQEKFDSALSTYKETLELFEEQGNDAGKAGTIQNIGKMYFEIGKPDSALIYLNQALQLSEEIGDPRTFAFASLILSNLYIRKGNFSKARSYLNNTEEIVQELGDYVRLQEYYQTLFSVDSAQGFLASAIQNLQLSYRYRDSVYNEDNVRKLTQTQMSYDFEKKEAEAKAEQEKKNVIAAKELQRQKLMRNGFIGGFAIVLIFAGVFFRQRNKISKEKARSEELLLNILPYEVAEELKEKGNAEAKLIGQVTVLFTDFKGFTQLSEKLSPKELVAEINECFSAFDLITHKYGVEKIKTIGDAYMAAGGLPIPNKTHASDVVKAALELQKYMLDHKRKKEASGELFFEIRIGIHTGPVVAGIVGIKKFAYDIWGDTVNTASRMESSGEAGKVNISGTTYELVKDQFICVHRGKVQAKGKGEVDMYFVESALNS